MKEPKTMTHHDYKEVWNFLYRKGYSPDQIPNIGIEAWREAKKLGFKESSEWGYIPRRRKKGFAQSVLNLIGLR